MHLKESVFYITVLMVHVYGMTPSRLFTFNSSYTGNGSTFSLFSH